MIELRDYQKEAIDSIYAYYSSGQVGNSLIVAPTGSGKGWIIAKFIEEALSFPDQKVLLLSHRKELLQQTAGNLLKLWPDAPVGIYSAGLMKKQLGRAITIAGIQSIYKKGSHLGHINLILVDEAHLIPAEDDGMYRRFISDVQATNPKVKVIGFTATPYRLKTGSLIDDGGIFSDIICDIDVAMLVAQGYLSKLVSKHAKAQGDLSDVGTRGGEFIPAQAEAAMNKVDLTKAIISEIEVKAKDRKSWLVFCSGVKHAEDFTLALRERGHSAECVIGDTPSLFRAQHLEDFKKGRLKCLVNCDVLTTGFDAPNVDTLILLRPTKSTGLYVQILGRGMRLSEGKENCLVLDFAGNVKRHGPIDAIKLKKKPDGGVEISRAPTKACPNCESEINIACRECPDCGFMFPERELKIEKTASSDAPMMSEPQWCEVKEITYRKHFKENSPPSFRVNYRIGPFITVSEWVCFDHGGYAREKARMWWAKRRKEGPIPTSVDEALTLTRNIKEPTRICLKKDGRFDRVVLYDFSEIKQLETEEGLPNI
jgi:DNA repair protein RadD